MVPGLTLRTVLETTPNLTIDRLTKFLEAHYEEKNAHDLFNAMKNMIRLYICDTVPGSSLENPPSL